MSVLTDIIDRSRTRQPRKEDLVLKDDDDRKTLKICLDIETMNRSYEPSGTMMYVKNNGQVYMKTDNGWYEIGISPYMDSYTMKGDLFDDTYKNSHDIQVQRW